MHSAKKVEESNYHTRSASYSMSINDDEEEDYPIEVSVVRNGHFSSILHVL